MDGIEARHGKRGGSIRVHFMFKGVECRETLKLPPTKANLLYAQRLRGEALNAIGKENFNYRDYFPDSKRAAIFGHATPTRITTGERFTRFLEECAVAVERGGMSPSTLNGYRKIITGRLYPEFGAVQLTGLSAPLIREFVGRLCTTAKTARNILSVLNLVLSDAVNDGLIEENPLGKVEASRLIDRTSKRSSYKVEPFAPDEVAAILAAAGAHAPLFKFAFATGLRTSELIALEWRDIDRAAKLVHVSRAQVVGVVKGTKTDAGARTVELSAAALEALQELSVTTKTRVFINHNTGRPICDDSTIRKLWEPIIKAAGVRYRNPYQARHTFASSHLSAGANPWWLATQMGHVDVSMIFKHYGRWVKQVAQVSPKPAENS